MSKIEKNACGAMLLHHALEIFKGFELFPYPKKILEVWFGVSQSLIKLLLGNLKKIDATKEVALKVKILEFIDILKKQIEKT